MAGRWRRGALIAPVAVALALGGAAGCSSDPVASTSTVPASTRSSVSPTVGPLAGSSPSATTFTPPASPSVAVTQSPSIAPPVDATTAEAPTETTDQSPTFRSTIAAIDASPARRMGTSWRPGCPVAVEDLRYLTVSYVRFDGLVYEGELVVAAEVAEQMVEVFARLFELRYPIASLRLVDDFAGSDDASMAANNTSAFNCRPITGSTGTFSEHSYGTAIDLNPVQNPYVSGGTVLPAAGRDFLDRPPAPGVLHAGDPVVQAFASIGWSWGGAWDGPVDYQHFSRSGR